MAPSPSEVLDALATAELTAQGYLAGASNHTILVRVGDVGNGLHAVYKPARGERPLWDFPSGTLHRREVAAYRVSRFLGWDLVPPTVLREGPFGEGSVQAFVPHDPEQHYFVLIDDADRLSELARLAFFDLLINNADRKGSHILLDISSGRLMGIDHGVAFHVLPKLRTVIWDLGARPVPVEWRADVQRLAAALRESGELAGDLATLLSDAEIDALRRRAELLGDLRLLPEVPDDRRPYPWPPL
jgi:Phosphatidylinositol 3- and 4-kinase